MSLAATPSTVLAAGLFPGSPIRVAPEAVIAVAALPADCRLQSPEARLGVCMVDRAAQSSFERAGHIGTIAAASEHFHYPTPCPINWCEP